jgi:hypothetical protein
MLVRPLTGKERKKKGPLPSATGHLLERTTALLGQQVPCSPEVCRPRPIDTPAIDEYRMVAARLGYTGRQEEIPKDRRQENDLTKLVRLDFHTVPSTA